MDSGIALPGIERNPKQKKGHPRQCLEPLHELNSTLDALDVVNMTEQTHYTEEGLIILETIAFQAALAFQNSLLGEKEQHSLDRKTRLYRMRSGFIAIASHELRSSLDLFPDHSTYLLPVNTSQTDAASRIFIP
jgi:K+-sensing histidine kinase KdpD